MSSKAQYQTKQREELLIYLKEMNGQHVTVHDICDHFENQGTHIGMTTVYRQLEKMVDQGLVTKYTLDAGSPACFEYNGHETDQLHETCYHCKCEVCGKLVHMHCEELVQIQLHMKEHHRFIIDPKRTVFYGRCENCAGQQ